MSVLKPTLSVIEALLKEHVGLLELASKKKEVLIQGDMDELNAIGREEIEYVHRIEGLEAERLAAARLLSIRIGVQAEQLKPENLLDLAADKTERQLAQERFEALREVLHRLKHLTHLNKQLLQQSLQFAQVSIEILTESPQVPTYGGSGQTQTPYQTARTSLFDSKA